MEYFTYKILELLIQNTNELDLSTSDIVITDKFINNVQSKLQYRNTENNRYFYQLFKYLCKLKNKKFKIYIKCNNDNCKKCFGKKNKLKYYKNIPNIEYIINNSYDKQLNRYINKVNLILFQKNIPVDIIKYINSYIDNNCIYKSKIIKLLKNITHYNIFYNIFIRNKKINKYFRIDKFCEFDNNCIMCNIVYHMLMNITHQVDHYSKFLSCRKSEYLKNASYYGFTCYDYYILNGANTKIIQLNDYDIFEFSSDDDDIIVMSDTDSFNENTIYDTYNMVDPPYIDFWD